MKEDETSTSIGGKLQQFSLGGSLISLQDKASGGSQAWSVEECFAFDRAAARTPEAFLNSVGKTFSLDGEKETHLGNGSRAPAEIRQRLRRTAGTGNQADEENNEDSTGGYLWRGAEQKER